jgi:hypothetical protein
MTVRSGTLRRCVTNATMQLYITVSTSIATDAVTA